MRRWIFLGLLGAVAALWAADRFWLSASCAPSHSAATARLPLFGPATKEGLVRIPAGGLQFRARIGGFSNRGGDGVILLHGFPETSIIWEPVIRILARDGYRVVAFDQRGYSALARSDGVSSYAMDELSNRPYYVMFTSYRDDAPIRKRASAVIGLSPAPALVGLSGSATYSGTSVESQVRDLGFATKTFGENSA